MWWYIKGSRNHLTLDSDVVYYNSIRACKDRIQEYINDMEIHMERERKPKYYSYQTHTLNMSDNKDEKIPTPNKK